MEEEFQAIVVVVFLSVSEAMIVLRIHTERLNFK